MKPQELHNFAERWARRGGFTLVELLVVLAIITIVLSLSVPLVRSLTGSRSLAAGQGTLDATVSFARAQAIRQRAEIGLVCFLDANTDRTTLAMAQRDATTQQVSLLAGYRWQTLPNGIDVQTIFSTAANADRYLRTGLVLFDGTGQVVFSESRYSASARSTLGLTGGNGGAVFTPQIGYALYVRDVFRSAGYTDSDPHFTGGSYSTGASNDEANEEQWLDGNGFMVMVSRFTGRLVKLD